MNQISTAFSQDASGAMFMLASYLVLGGFGLLAALAILVAIAHFVRWCFDQIRQCFRPKHVQQINWKNLEM